MNTHKNQVPLKNYIILILIAIVTIFLVIFFAKFYQEQAQYDTQNNNIMTFLSEIKIEEFDNYIQENHDVIVYLSSSIDNFDVEYEKNLKKYITKKNLIKDFVYLDTSNLETDFYERLKTNYLSKKLQKQDIHLDQDPTLLIIKNQKISHVFHSNKLNIRDTEKFIQENWVKDHD